MIDVISKGAAGSWQMENRFKTMNDGKYDFGFAVDWMRKDLGICLEEADNNGAKLPVRGPGRPVLQGSAGNGRQALGYLSRCWHGWSADPMVALGPSSSAAEIVDMLRAAGSEENRAGMARFGIEGRQSLRRIAGRIAEAFQAPEEGS